MLDKWSLKPADGLIEILYFLFLLTICWSWISFCTIYTENAFLQCLHALIGQKHPNFMKVCMASITHMQIVLIMLTLLEKALALIHCLLLHCTTAEDWPFPYILLRLTHSDRCLPAAMEMRPVINSHLFPLFSWLTQFRNKKTALWFSASPPVSPSMELDWITNLICSLKETEVNGEGTHLSFSLWQLRWREAWFQFTFISIICKACWDTNPTVFLQLEQNKNNPW